MGLFDVFKSKQGPSFTAEPPSDHAKESAKATWRQTQSRPDEHARLDAAVGLVDVECFDDALAAFQSLATAFPQSRGEYERWQAQIHYLNLSYRKTNEKEKLKCFTAAYALFLQAAEHGDRTQEATAYELLELLVSREEVSQAKKRENLESFIRLFPDGVDRHRAQNLLDTVG
jgi:hypothetical protein